MSADIELTPAEKVATARMYNGSFDNTMMGMLAIDLVKSIAIEFPGMHAATSWANANDIEDKVNVIWHPIHFNEKVVIRYAPYGE